MRAAHGLCTLVLAIVIAVNVGGQEANPSIGGRRLSDWAMQLAKGNQEQREEAVWKILFLLYEGKPIDRAVPQLDAALRDPAIDVRVIAACVLARAFPPRRELLLPLLLEGLRAGDRPWLRENAAAVLSLYGPAAAPAVADLTACLEAMPPADDPQDSSGAYTRMREACCTALGRIGPAAVGALPQLQERMNDPQPQVRLAAAESIVLLDPSHALDILPVLQQVVAAQDVDETVRERASGILRRVLVADNRPAEPEATTLDSGTSETDTEPALAPGPADEPVIGGEPPTTAAEPVQQSEPAAEPAIRDEPPTTTAEPVQPSEPTAKPVTRDEPPATAAEPVQPSEPATEPVTRDEPPATAAEPVQPSEPAAEPVIPDEPPTTAAEPVSEPDETAEPGQVELREFPEASETQAKTLPGVVPAGFGNLAGTLLAVLDTQGVPCTAARLHGMLGHAFTFSMKEGGGEVWQQAEIDWVLFFGMLDHLGLRWHHFDAHTTKASEEELQLLRQQTWQAVTASIDRGVPAIAWQPMTVEQRDAGLAAYEWALLVGYDRARQEYVVRHQAVAEEYRVRFDGFGYSDPVGWYHVIVAQAADTTDLAGAADLAGEIMALRHAVAFANGNRVDEPAYPVDAVGFTAYELWRDAFAAGTADAEHADSHASYLVTMREHAATFLQEITAQLTEEQNSARKALTEAAGFYSRELVPLRRVRQLARRAHKRGSFRPAELQEGAYQLRIALASERLAVGRIETALEQLE